MYLKRTDCTVEAQRPLHYMLNNLPGTCNCHREIFLSGVLLTFPKLVKWIREFKFTRTTCM